MVDFLSKVELRDRGSVLETVKRIADDGCGQLQVIMDFDRTMTRVHRDGVELDCSWGVMENSVLMPEVYRSNCLEIRNKYLPIEFDLNLTVAEKIPHMVSWYTEINKQLRDVKLNRDLIPKLVRSSNVELRSGLKELMHRLDKANVPLLILSAGLGDIVQEILNSHCLLTENVKIVSNFLNFDESGIVTGIKGDMIHVFNKNESSVHDSEYFAKLQERHNVVLIGDSIGDLNMALGVDGLNAVLNIGYLNHKKEDDSKRLKYYLEQGYDIVLVDDQTVDVPMHLFDLFLGENHGDNV